MDNEFIYAATQYSGFSDGNFKNPNLVIQTFIKKSMLLNIILGLTVVVLTVIVQGYGTGIWMKKYDKKRNLLSEDSFRKQGAKLLISTKAAPTSLA